MKHTFILLFFSLLFQSANCQLDMQWYIKNGYGLNGTTSNYSNPIDPTLDVDIKQVTHPSSNIPNAENALFIIKESGNMFSTDINGSINHTTSNGSNYTIDFTDPPLYMYFTNKYENDDPTQGILINNGSNYMQVAITNSVFPEVLWAHQDVIPSTDIVLAINKRNIKDEACTNLTSVDVCFDITSPTSTINNFIQPWPVFFNGGTAESILPGDNAKTPFSKSIFTNAASERCIKLLLSDFGTHQMMYINFRSAGDLSNLIAGDYDNLFKIYCGGTTQLIDDLAKDVRAAHDPNYCEVTSICEINNELYVNYHIEFYNEDPTPLDANSLGTSIQLPTCLDPNSLCIKDFRVGEMSYAGNNPLNWTTSSMATSFNGQEVSFDFPLAQLAGTLDPDKVPPGAIGRVDFCVKFNPTCDIHEADLSPAATPTTNFGGTTFEIHDFIDNLECTSSGIDGTQSFTCERPITTSDCSCACDGDIDDTNWWVYAGIAVIALLLMGILLRIRRRP